MSRSARRVEGHNPSPCYEVCPVASVTLHYFSANINDLENTSCGENVHVALIKSTCSLRSV
jgi:hypothetical protein